MGLCGSSQGLTDKQKQEIQESIKYDKELEHSKNATKKKKPVKILLLGTGESGKSTIFKQMQILYDGGFKQSHRDNFRSVVQKNVVESMLQLVRAADQKFGYQFEKKEEQDAAKFLEHNDTISMDNYNKIAYAIDLLWKSKTIQKTFEQRNQFYIVDSAEYFFKQIKEVCSPKYSPTDQDILRARMKTAGIYEHVFEIEKVGFHFVDVGGQQNERRKWIHCFAGVTTILFIAALSEYDQMLYEDEKTNRMLESLSVFDNIVNTQVFEETPLILFLNKRDLLEEKIKKGVDPSVFFPEYKDGCDSEKAAAFIEQLYYSRIKNRGRDLYAHQVTAIDTNNLQRVWNDCRGIILRQCLKDSGLT
jgi:GTPase SAR1 family protein